MNEEMIANEVGQTGVEVEAEPTVSLREENETLRGELQIRQHEYEVEDLLRSSGALSPKLLAAAVSGRFKRGEDGLIADGGNVLAAIRREFPEQFRSHSIDASAGRKPSVRITREALMKMRPQEIKRLDWAEVREAMSGR